MVSPACLFCRKSLDGVAASPSLEHLVPEAIGGWLTTRLVCVGCNSWLGLEVDRFVNDPLLLYLRDEIGLPIRREVCGEYYDEDWGMALPAQFSPRGGGFDDVKTVVKDGNRVLIQAANEDEALKIVRTMEARQKPGDPPLRWEQPYRRNQSDKVLIIRGERSNGDLALPSLLRRETAKVAIEYAAVAGSAHLALHQDLDSLRAYAIQGGEPNGEVRSMIPEGPVYLPRTGAVWVIGPVEASDQLRRMGDERLATLDSAAPPLGAYSHTNIYHRLVFRRMGGSACFELVLFGWFIIRIDVPPDLPLPWGRIEWWNFSRGKHGVAWL